jgi:hypothetical protein
MLPYVLMSVAGWYCFYQGLLSTGTFWRKLLGGVLLVCLVYPMADKFLNYEIYALKHPFWGRPYFKHMLESYTWIDKNLPKGILVASNEDQQGYFMNRPFVSIPPGRSFNCTNLGLYNRIYSPDYYVLSKKVDDKCFASIPHTKVFFNEDFRVFKVGK